jgi:hypothetical protein
MITHFIHPNSAPKAVVIKKNTIHTYNIIEILKEITIRCPGYKNPVIVIIVMMIIYCRSIMARFFKQVFHTTKPVLPHQECHYEAFLSKIVGKSRDHETYAVLTVL